jgi:hypothetical protein
MKKTELKELIKQVLKENKNNYMFFQNLITIKRAVDKMLEMDPQMVDMILSDGHDWANDHISTSKDDIEEVCSFLVGKMMIMEKGPEFTQKYDKDPSLKGKQSKLPDQLQKTIIKKTK